jgi:hypothetical protein
MPKRRHPDLKLPAEALEQIADDTRHRRADPGDGVIMGP